MARDQELQSDNLGVRFMMDAGLNLEELIGVMEILKQASGGQSREIYLYTSGSGKQKRKN
ncbi:MAG: M48 family metalloprotease [Saprospiraceae bacterium]|nr:M48 family metalloprotease [Candidatus Vicinibacter affinis]